MKERFDVVVVGGGPAGLSAALMLGRCRRRVAVCDDGQPRNAASHEAHGFLTRDGASPRELLRIAREQLGQYEVTLFDARAVDVVRHKGAFSVTLSSNRKMLGRKLLLATGLVDEVPRLDGIQELYGKRARVCFIARTAMAGKSGTDLSPSMAGGRKSPNSPWG